MGLNVKTTFRVRLDPMAPKEISKAVLGGLILYAQDVVAYAARNHPYQDRTGVNSRSIGWTATGPNGGSFGAVTLGGGGSTSSHGVKAKGKQISVAVATTSGYGGFLETGTSKMRAFPYILPAMRATKPKLKQHLTKVV